VYNLEEGVSAAGFIVRDVDIAVLSSHDLFRTEDLVQSIPRACPCLFQMNHCFLEVQSLRFRWPAFHFVSFFLQQ